MLEETTQSASMKPEARSRKTNGSTAFLGKVDGRSVIARRYRDLVTAYTEQLGGELTTWQAVKVSQLAGLTVRAEQLQTQIATGDPDFDDDALVRVENALRRSAAELGLDRPQDTKPDLNSYLAGGAA